MKNLTLLTWVTQLGLSVAVPPAGFLLLALWLRNSCGWGNWVLWVGIVLGLIGAIQGLITGLEAMRRMSAEEKKDPPPLSYNDHD